MDEQEARFTRLYETYYRNVFGYVVLRVAPQAADDVTNEVFTVAWRKIDEIPERALPWLLAVARNLARQSHGAAGQTRRLVDRMAGLTTDADLHAWDAADHVIARDHALAALRTLSPKEAEAVTLTAWHGLDPADAARVAGCSRATFTVRLHRGRRRLARALGASHDLGAEAPARAPRTRVIQEKP
ncbi:RNA polymerase sigma factor [Actinoallomurus rhizosphaericola]|uniref:RNA polymerase sigma factor n=1 Tax=Actinoallomurus rhizosphaericola TaxID=2952536 RepID=UPI0020906941|nr:RNA polymerase sigma factor [Actinoallomurus rhizosphaericola]MCO5991868.1 RNA polymerase sigma factor [Actinoallomurus rhizosphaericola]